MNNQNLTFAIALQSNWKELSVVKTILDSRHLFFNLFVRNLQILSLDIYVSWQQLGGVSSNE